jgi:hypothetical protein
VRLSPIWSSLAMALSYVKAFFSFRPKKHIQPFIYLFVSSISVVCSSLLLRLYKQPKFNNPGATASEVSNAEKEYVVEVV